MTDTPETDREEVIHPGSYEQFDWCFQYVDSNFARRLERQRNELLQICNRYLNTTELRELKGKFCEYEI